MWTLTLGVETFRAVPGARPSEEDVVEPESVLLRVGGRKLEEYELSVPADRGVWKGVGRCQSLSICREPSVFS